LLLLDDNFISEHKYCSVCLCVLCTKVCMYTLPHFFIVRCPSYHTFSHHMRKTLSVTLVLPLYQCMCLPANQEQKQILLLCSCLFYNKFSCNFAFACSHALLLLSSLVFYHTFVARLHELVNFTYF
jgi:hypothetical protein